MFIRDTGSNFFPTRVLDLKTSKKRRGNNLLFYIFLCNHKFHKIVNCLPVISEQVQKKLEPIDKELKYFLPTKLLLSSQNMD
jgi:hypothetical protein